MYGMYIHVLCVCSVLMHDLSCVNHSPLSPLPSPVTPPDSADIRSSLLDGRQQQQQQQQQQGGATSNGGGPFLNIDHDPLTSRDSYASFVGGFDSGKPDSDLIRCVYMYICGAAKFLCAFIT